MTRTTRLLLVVVAALAPFAAACGSGSDGAARSTTTGAASAASTTAAPTDDLSGEITVSAAASLTEGFTQLGKDFEKDHPATKITLTFDSSSTLSAQILEGAPADVFASADQANMTKLTDAGLVDGTPEVFARNELVIVTKPGNPEAIKTLADLSSAGVISLCGESVPCGKFAQQALDAAGVTIDEGRVTRGQNVKATLTAVTDGDAVAGIVYATDAQAAGTSVATVTIPAAQNAIATYPIGVLKAAKHAAVAQAFLGYVTSREGERTLRRFGFLAPR